MLVLEGRTRTRAEVLADHAAQSKALLEPVASIDGELVDGGSGSYRNTANRVAVTDGEFTQERRHLGVGEGREAGQRDHANVPPADARLESGDEVLVAKHRIEKGGWTRRPDVADASVDAGRKVRQQRGHLQRRQLPHRTYRILEFPESLLEPVELASPSYLVWGARQKHPGDSGLHVGGRAKRDRKHAVGLVVPPLGRILNLAFAIERGAHRVWERPVLIIDTRMTDEIDVVHEAVVQPKQRAVGLRAMRVQFFTAGGVEIKPQARVRRQERAVLHRDRFVVDRNRVIELVRQSEQLLPFSPQILELLQKHDSYLLLHARISFGVGTEGRIRGLGAKIEPRAG